MFRLILALAFLFPAISQAAHLSTNIRCVDDNEGSSVTMKFVVVKKNKLHRLSVVFEASKDGPFKAGDELDIFIDGELVGALKLRNKRTTLKGVFRKQGFDPDFDIDVAKKSLGEIADLSCSFKR